MKTETLDEGRLTVAAEFSPLLAASGLDSFDKIMALPGGTVARDFPGRRTVRLELKTPHGGVQGIYLKRYEPHYLSGWGRLLRLCRWPGSEDEALREWLAIQQVAAAGIRTARPIAVGQWRSGGIVTRSFLMTAEIPGAVEGHLHAEGLAATERRRFLAHVAEMARRLHEAGLVHKDFYVGHVLVTPNPSGAELFLIDLQRVVKPWLLFSRWVAKDLGALGYSMFNAGATYTDLLRTFLAYRQSATLGEAEKCQARKVMRRILRLRRRQPRHGGLVRQRE